ncbi:Unknown protein [Striga hermonthica]|uniref:No apical meristem-associated C-terminal domain-containing protein n=1 Tax=Striga hermonthica TaxID=68872 RepID=A0A9N7NCY1_STRHE|nr:Unknown protein [Striga hermonthica]
MQVSPAVPSARPNHKRSKNFSDHEDEVLVSAWLNISLDPVVGKDKKRWQVAEAYALYKAEDQHNKAFQFMHCWDKLRTQPKWLAKLDELVAAKTSNKKQKTRPTADPSATLPSEIGQNAVEDLDANALTRPIERVANEKLLLEVRRQEVQLQRKRDEERIMTMDLSAMPDEQKKYYMCLRAEIMS